MQVDLVFAGRMAFCWFCRAAAQLVKAKKKIIVCLQFYMQIMVRINGCEIRNGNSSLRITIWHHSGKPRDVRKKILAFG